MAAMLISRRVDAAPFYSIHHYYQNKAAQAAGEEIVALPFVEPGFAIYAASIIATDKTIAQKPELTTRFLKAVRRALEWARDNPQEACELHIVKVPEVKMDDCLGSLKATMTFVFNEHEKQFGFEQVSPERLKATWEGVATSQDLPLNWDPRQAFETRFAAAAAK